MYENKDETEHKRRYKILSCLYRRIRRGGGRERKREKGGKKEKRKKEGKRERKERKANSAKARSMGFGEKRISERIKRRGWSYRKHTWPTCLCRGF